jgi:hypothetical protein
MALAQTTTIGPTELSISGVYAHIVYLSGIGYSGSRMALHLFDGGPYTKVQMSGIWAILNSGCSIMNLAAEIDNVPPEV